MPLLELLLISFFLICGEVKVQAEKIVEGSPSRIFIALSKALQIKNNAMEVLLKGPEGVNNLPSN
jgi:hypothetical protein